MTLLEWQKRITRRVFVDSDGLTLGELAGLLGEMWDDAMEQSLRASLRGPRAPSKDWPIV